MRLETFEKERALKDIDALKQEKRALGEELDKAFNEMKGAQNEIQTLKGMNFSLQ